MTITEIKSALLENIKEYAEESAKSQLVAWINDTVLPAAQEIADTYVSELKTSAASETGWCKFRDSVFLPVAIDGAFYLISAALTKIVASAESTTDTTTTTTDSTTTTETATATA